MICKKCGNEVKSDDFYCPKCGACLRGIITKKGQPFKDCFSKDGLFNWHGRRNRKPYFWFGFCLNAFVDVSYKAIIPFLSENIVIILLYIALLIVYVYIDVINTIKRGHDVGISGLITGSIVGICVIGEALLGFLGESVMTITKSGMNKYVILFIVFSLFIGNGQKLFLTFKKGHSGSNVYGPDPFEHLEEDS